jgi:hypothetical protein
MSAPRKAAPHPARPASEAQEREFANLQLLSILSILEFRDECPKLSAKYLGHLADNPPMMAIVIEALKRYARSQDFRAWLARDRDHLQAQAHALSQARQDTALQAMLSRVLGSP